MNSCGAQVLELVPEPTKCRCGPSIEVVRPVPLFQTTGLIIISFGGEIPELSRRRTDIR